MGFGLFGDLNGVPGPGGEGIGDGAVGIVVATGERGYDDLWGVSLGILRLMLKSYIQVHRSFL